MSATVTLLDVPALLLLNLYGADVPTQNDSARRGTGPAGVVA